MPKSDDRRTLLDPGAIVATRLMIPTGAPARYPALHWAEVDFERRRAFLPDSKTGRKTLVLSGAAIRVLRALPQIGLAFVIPGG